MNKEFIPYEEALELKQLGFDEPCFGFYTYKAETRRYTNYDGELNDFQTLKNSKITLGDDWCTIPLYQQAFRWFRKPENGSHNHLDFMYEYLKDDSKTYEEAELACLRKLIEIVKTTK
jgi:hypothetical protein